MQNDGEMTETLSTKTGHKTRCHPGKHPGMLCFVTRDCGGRDDVMRKSPILSFNVSLSPDLTVILVSIISHTSRAVAEVGHLELIFISCPYLSFLRKNSWSRVKTNSKGVPRQTWSGIDKGLNEKRDRFRSGSKHPRTSGEHSPVRAHTSTRSCS